MNYYSNKVLFTLLFISASFSIFNTTNQARAADNWPCEVLLCLSNPAGPTAVSQCVPPIKKLYKRLRKGKSFPVCKAEGTKFKYLARGYQPYEDCTGGRRLVTNRGRDKSGIPVCTKTVSSAEYFGNSTASASNLDTGDSFIRDGDRGNIIGVIDNSPVVSRKKPNFLTYTSPTTGTQTIRY